ncbi:delta-lactam-biosynthetic de-N-acetylase [Bacillus massiliigorillae]|uniref:delta-lactam-biosynthetic de-N-acetylase n=1 Tax=Bacillus massiliigorillae TaxID=1243664 RepID=UPI0005A953A2|nr:delta-lactam-biosynthetic de-N-acetylase [Bacillus massiliigorillae]
MRNIYMIIVSIAIALSLAIPAHANVPNKAYGWGLVKSKDGIPADAGPELNAIVEKHGAVYKGNPSKKVLYLTFDNGYENGYTAQFLDVLKKHKVPGIFFVTGHYLKSAPDLAKRMVKEGHIIGNHSWHHPDMTTQSQAQILEELNTVQQETARLTGQKTMKYLRPPRGIFSERTLQIANEAGYKHIFWSLAYKDWDVNAQRGADYAYNEIMKQIHPGAILLIHTISKDNAGALERVIVDLKKQGYTFKSIDYLMKQPNSKAQKNRD